MYREGHRSVNACLQSAGHGHPGASRVTPLDMADYFIVCTAATLDIQYSLYILVPPLSAHPLRLRHALCCVVCHLCFLFCVVPPRRLPILVFFFFNFSTSACWRSTSCLDLTPPPPPDQLFAVRV